MIKICSLLVISLVIVVTCGALRGGWSKTSLPNDDPIVVFMVDGVNQYYAAQGDDAVRTLIRTEIRSQVVAGMNYEITAYLANGDQTEKCISTIWVRSWLSFPEKYQLTEGPVCTSA